MALLDTITSLVGQGFFANPRSTPHLERFGTPVTNPSDPGALESFGRPPGLDLQGVKPRNFPGKKVLNPLPQPRLERQATGVVNSRGHGPLQTPQSELLGDLGIGQKVNVVA
ncbi:MAG: hypothetical protein HY722_13015 [Planctomycetes bacterium]|nr:hypothetical protein [Planctomycetota bacterium]